MTQLLSVIHEIQTTFDNNPSFDEGGIFDIGVEGELHLPLKNRENRAQRVFLMVKHICEEKLVPEFHEIWY